MTDSANVIFAKFSTVESLHSTTERNLPGPTEYLLYNDAGDLLDRWLEDPRREQTATDWARARDAALGQVALKWRSYSPATYGVLFYLVSKMRWGNYVPVRQSVIAEDLGMSPSSVSKAVKQLTADRVLLEVADPSFPRSKAWKLNANFAYKGKTLRWRSARNRDGDLV